MGQNDTGFSCDGSAGTFRVMFKEPVEVLPNVNYTACATLKVCLTLPHPDPKPIPGPSCDPHSATLPRAPTLTLVPTQDPA